MAIAKVNIQNYKYFHGEFCIDLHDGVNVLVGDNETGKSTILEAINLALSGILNGRYLRNELCQYLFNQQAVSKYIDSMSQEDKLPPPSICIEVFFANDHPLFEGNGNSERTKASGVALKVEFDPEYQDEYKALLDSGDLTTIPLEYYRVTWKSFARQAITRRSIPIKSVLIDSESKRYQNGSDVYISQIIRDDLEDAHRVGLAQAYRRLQDAFVADESVKAINTRIKGKSKISDKDLHLSVDLSPKNSWETNLMTYLDKTPFHQIGKGEQCIVKTNLALGHKKAQEANLILLEEPENHLSHARLNGLMHSIIEGCADKQIIITTHSSFVANKLGLDHLVLLNDQRSSRLPDLHSSTYEFFRKLPGYQTLRLILCRKAVLVEGDSDELVFQRAYMDRNEGRLPINDGIDVISVGLTFKRFLDIAIQINQPVAVVTDNDGDYMRKIVKKYEDYKKVDCISIFADDRETLNTLEPQFVDANKTDLTTLCDVIGVNHKKYDTHQRIVEYMIGNKTTWALQVFESKRTLQYPKYIIDAVTWCNAE
jgi:putative ATP-dependent endonuclease of the OLD family